MNYTFKNDELFFLAVLIGADSIVGISNPLDNVSNDLIKERWQEISEEFLKKGYLYFDDEGDMCLEDEIAKVISACAFPDLVMLIYYRYGEIEEECSEYIFIKSYMAIYLKNNNECSITTFEKAQELDDFLINIFKLEYLNEDDIQYMLSTTSENFNKSLEHFQKGKVKKAVKMFTGYGIDEDEITNLLSAFSQEENCVNFASFKYYEGEPRELTDENIRAIFGISRNDGGVWMMKITVEEDYEKVSIYKSNAPDMIAAMF